MSAQIWLELTAASAGLLAQKWKDTAAGALICARESFCAFELQRKTLSARLKLANAVDSKLLFRASLICCFCLTGLAWLMPHLSCGVIVPLCDVNDDVCACLRIHVDPAAPAS
jgi:hypothetical protein